MKPLLKLIDYGQSYWLDNLTRDMISGGELRRRVAEEGLRGVTSNPKIFDEAITSSESYDRQIRELVQEGKSTPQIYEALVVNDVRDACDVLRPVYEESDAMDGYVSLEVSPHLAHDAQGSIRDARRLYREVDRPNLFIKIPGTAAGLGAIEELLTDGINVNITLLFSVERYRAVAEAYMRALERRLERGRPLDSVASVASFFLSRIDVLVDELLEHRIRGVSDSTMAARASELRGRTAVANAKLAYQVFEQISAGERWQRLAEHGARPQRLLWASTSTKNPQYSDVMYVEPLIGPRTVNTMPARTISAFADHGRAEDTLREGMDAAANTLGALQELGIDIAQVTEQLENEGVQKFIDPYDDLMDNLAAKRVRYLNRQELEPLNEMSRQLRREVIRMTSEAGSGHATSCMSAAELVSALFFHVMRWDPGDPHARNMDRFVLSKGHAAPILWAALSEAGAVDEDPMTLRRIDSSLEGHPTPTNPGVQVATGSLGQGLAAANGIALANRLDGIDARVYCLLGDGECSEGSVWEAAQFAALQGLKNVVAVVDVNALGQSGPAPYHHDTAVFADRFKAFGWKTVQIDGHDMTHVLDAYDKAAKGGP
ncbi:MAG: transaldolase, partial [Gammaproteobacteria bacterium]